MLTKKELLILRREREKLSRVLSGMRDMTKIPSAIWVVDTKKEVIAVAEAHKLGIPVVAILDTNCDPDEVDYKIPGNDDAIRSVTLLTRVIADAVAEGLRQRSAKAQGTTEAVEPGAGEPLADWEAELLGGQNEVPEVVEAPQDADAPLDATLPVDAEAPLDSQVLEAAEVQAEGI
jgi:small subunit ribosomal protein S2